MADRLSSIRGVLRKHDQEHLLAFYDRLTGDRQQQLLDQLRQIDFEALWALLDGASQDRLEPDLPADLEPAPYYAHEPGSAYDAAHYRRKGEELVQAGKVAVFCVAGGQGTRLGWSSPKGTFPGTVVSGKPLLGVLAEQIRANQNRYRVTIPFYIMTSPLNDAATRAFMQDNNCFGLNRRDIFMFPQGLLPSVDADTGMLLLADEGTVAMNPDGHGGSIKALATSGAIDAMDARGIEHISYVQVDNPLVMVIDPLFIGLHAAAPDSSAQMSSKMVPKVSPDEKVGVFCRIGGKTSVIEYTHLPKQLAGQRDESGQLRFRAGSIAVHIISVKFVQDLMSCRERALPLHPARKKVEHIDPQTGRRVVPEQPNAIKLETFVFDALPRATSSIVYETSRVEEFAPIKNARGVDSPASSYQLQSDRAGAWLEANGVKVPRDPDDGHVTAKIELSPLTAIEPQDLSRVKLPESIAPGESLVL